MLGVALVCALACALPVGAWAATEVDDPPFAFTTDVGASAREQKATAVRFLRPMQETARFFIASYGLSPTCFADYAAARSGANLVVEPGVRVHLWRNYDDFLADFQARYHTKSLPGAFFGTTQDEDADGHPQGPMYREIGAVAESASDEEILRHLYHEMGHLFMSTYIVQPVEVPSWVEEGTAELFQYRPGNGTHPEAERDQRMGWLVEMLDDGSEIPWPEMIKVHNLDNLAFTWKDPLRATVQYVQAWSMVEYLVSNRARQDAFKELLAKFRAEADACVQHLDPSWSDQVVADHLANDLYQAQERLFKECYGNDLTEVEGSWKDWVRDNYEAAAAHRPIMRYHRGDWYLLRASRMRQDDAAPGRARIAADAAAADARVRLLDLAQARFDDAVAHDAQAPEGYVGLGRVALMRHDLSGALRQFDRAVGLGASSFEAELYAGLARLQGGQAQAALAPLGKAASLHPTDFDANFFLGRAEAAAGDPQWAVQHLRRARDLDRAQAGDCAWIEGAVLYRKGAFADAGRVWERAGQLGVELPELPLYRALALASAGDRDAARAVLQPVAAKDAGRAFLKALAGSEPLPAVLITADGWPTIDYAAVGLVEVAPAATAAAGGP
jgi:hypothetical protein